jgi:hypothetical protein
MSEPLATFEYHVAEADRHRGYRVPHRVLRDMAQSYARLQGQLEAVTRERDALAARLSNNNRWPDPLQSSQAEAMRNGKIDHTEILSLFDRMQREIDFHRSSPAEARAARLEALERAAIIWWRSRRPINGWTEQDHLANPAINCCDVIEGDLARAVAALDVKEAG